MARKNDLDQFFQNPHITWVNFSAPLSLLPFAFGFARVGFTAQRSRRYPNT